VAQPFKPDFADDTDPKALEVLYELQRRRAPGQKAMDVFNLSALLIRLSEAGVRSRYPDATEREVFLRAAALRLPRDIMIKVYGWDPAEHG